MIKRIGLYPGSFDPFTNGHLYLIKSAAKLFDEVVVVLAVNRRKKRRIVAEKMVKAIEQTLQAEDLKNVRVELWTGVVARLAEQLGAQFLIRGLRDGVDYKYEENLAETNHFLTRIETVYFRAGEQSFVSSSIVMELWGLGENISGLVPAAVLQLIDEAAHEIV